MGSLQTREGTDISSFFGIIRRRGLIVLLAVVVGALVGYGLAKSKSDEYTGRSNVQLRESTAEPTQSQVQFAPGVPDSSKDREDLALADGVKSRVQRQLARRVGAGKAAQLVNAVEAFSPQEAASIEITAKAGDGRTAGQLANAMAAATVAERRDRSLRRLRRAIAVAQRQLDRLGGSRLTQTNPSAVQAQQRLDDLRQAAAVQDGDADVTKRAGVPMSPSSPKPKRDGLIGAIAGLLIGFVLAMVREQVDRRLTHSKDLEDVFGLPVLATVPRSRALGSDDGVGQELPPGAAEPFQMLRANLRFINTETELRSVVVTSPGVGDGKSTVSMNLARAEASLGRRVLLIEADIRRPQLGPLLGVEAGTGLAAYLADENVELVHVIQRVLVGRRTNGTTPTMTMDVLVAGGVPSNPSELINAPRMHDLVSQAEKDYDLVVVDTSPAGLVADAIPLMSQASAVVIVGRVGRITGPEADHLREQLQRIDAPAFGLVANFASSREQGYGYY